MIDVVAIGAGRGHPSGGRVRLHRKALALERGEFVADGGAGDGEPGRLEHGLRTDGLARPDVLLDQCLQHLVPTLVPVVGPSIVHESRI
jgi:hypothetical protein